MNDHALLIDALGDDASPVQRPAPAALRALAWTVVCLAAGFFATRVIAAPWSRIGFNGLVGGVSAAICLAAGALLLIAAFETSIPGRRSRALPAAALFGAAWALGCIADLASRDWPAGRMGEGIYCFKFIVIACAPMTLAVIVALRRTYSIRPVRTMLLGAGGAAFLSFALLAFCHHGRLHLVDFSMHLAAVAVVIAVSTAAGSGLVSIPRGTLGVRGVRG
jgi:hypothetical protein